MKQVELTFQYTKEEYVKAERQYLFASKVITKTSVIVLGLSLPFSIFYLFLSSFSVFASIVSGIISVTLLTGAALYFYIPAYKFKQTLKYQQEYHLIFSNDNIRFTTATIHSDLKWDIYSEIWESSDFYFLIQAPRIYALIPKRAFPDLAIRQAFEEMAVSKLASAKRI